MIERLTERNKDGEAFHPFCFMEEHCIRVDDGDCRECEFTQKVCEKLAGYEDTGLTPEQIIDIDKLYAMKCLEVNDLKAENEAWKEKCKELRGE